MKELEFNKIKLPVVLSKDDVAFVSVRHVCDSLEIPFQSQHVKLTRSLEFTCHDIVTHDAIGREQKMFCIQADQAHLWVAGISSAKITNPERQKAFIAYKHECANTLYTHFMQKGEDMLGITQELREFRKDITSRIDHLTGMQDTVFGSSTGRIMTLIQEVAMLYGVDGRTVWGWIKSECDISSYKKMEVKVENFLLNKLGKGIKLVKEEK